MSLSYGIQTSKVSGLSRSWQNRVFVHDRRWYHIALHAYINGLPFRVMVLSSSNSQLSRARYISNTLFSLEISQRNYCHFFSVLTMKTATFGIIAAAILSLASAAPATPLVTVPGVCKVCDGFGIACIAACIAGGPVDPICDLCAGPTIGTCLGVSGSTPDLCGWANPKIHKQMS